MYKLSIVVPTYNRANFLRSSTVSILESIQGHEEQVEFLISNNGSTDHTEEVVTSLMQEFPHITYFKNDVTLRPDEHFPQAVSRASGEFYWLIGDDDYLEKNAVPEVLKRLDRGHNLVICNFSVWTKDLSNKLAEIGLDLKDDHSIKAPDQLLSYFEISLGYISSIIGRRSDVMSFSDQILAPFRQFTFPMVFPLYSSLIKECNAAFISSPVLRNRSGNSTESTDWYLYYATGTTTIFNGLRKTGYSRWAVRAANNKVLAGYIIFVTIEYKLQKILTLKKVTRLLRSYWSYPLFWLVCVPIIVLPFKVISPFRDTLRKLPARVKSFYSGSLADHSE